MALKRINKVCVFVIGENRKSASTHVINWTELKMKLKRKNEKLKCKPSDKNEKYRVRIRKKFMQEMWNVVSSSSLSRSAKNEKRIKMTGKNWSNKMMGDRPTNSPTEWMDGWDTNQPATRTTLRTLFFFSCLTIFLMNKKTKEIYKCSIKIREKSTSSSKACTVTNFCKLEKSEKTNDLFFL